MNKEGIRVIVGLGNPGLEYAKTRHNVGFMTLDRLAEKHNAVFMRNRFGLIAKWGNIFLLKPLTFMNLSGDAVGALARFYKITAAEILVISDDLDLPLGTIRVRARGSSGGHNGLKSIIHALGTENFPRVKIGIGRPTQGMTVIDWVLSRFTAADWTVLQPALEKASDAAEWVVVKGPVDAMNHFNSH
nr:aminoacyl-tRNA hydrolase [Sulfobacillus sp. hq2]